MKVVCLPGPGPSLMERLRMIWTDSASRHRKQGGLRSSNWRKRVETELTSNRSRPKRQTLTFSNMLVPACGDIEATSKPKRQTLTCSNMLGPACENIEAASKPKCRDVRQSNRSNRHPPWRNPWVGPRAPNEDCVSIYIGTTKGHQIKDCPSAHPAPQ